MKSETNTNPLNDPVSAWSPFSPVRGNPWNLQKTAHLFRRAAFGANWNMLQKGLQDGPRKTIAGLFQPLPENSSFQSTYDGYEKRGVGKDSVSEGNAWWLHRILNSPFPLLEKLTLFWHHVTAVSNRQVNDASLVCSHIQSLRKHALADFRSTFKEVFRHPAIYMQFNAVQNRKALPDNRFAEAILKTTGISQYTKQDVREIARSFTGLFVLRNKLRFIEREHDKGAKVIFGKKGAWKTDDAVGIILERPEASESFVKRLYTFLVSDIELPSSGLLKPLLREFRKDYNTGKLVKRILESNLFFSGTADRKIIKSPLDFCMEILKTLEGKASPQKLSETLSELGQNLYMPPALTGWRGGRSWINSASLTGRSNLVFALLYNTKEFESTLDPLSIAKKYGHTTQSEAKQFLVKLMIQGFGSEQLKDLMHTDSQEVEKYSKDLKKFVHKLTTLPEYQLL